MAGSPLSVIVCTHNRPLDLERCLEGLAALADPAEVIVVDSASQPSCRELVNGFAARIEHLTYVREDRPGHSRARNQGIAAAGGEIIAFLDEDASPRCDGAGRIVAPFETDPAVGCVGGVPSSVPRCDEARLARRSTAPVRRDHAVRSRGARGDVERRVALRREHGVPPRCVGPGRAVLGGARSRRREPAVRRRLRADRVGAASGVEDLARTSRDRRSRHPRRACESRYYWRRLWWQGITRARSSDARPTTGLRVLAAAPLRLCLYALTRDRVYLYRVAETGGYFKERLRPRQETA